MDTGKDEELQAAGKGGMAFKDEEEEEAGEEEADGDDDTMSEKEEGVSEALGGLGR